MVFSSVIFLFSFLPLTLILYFILPGKTNRIRNVFLFAVSIFFYAWGEPKFVFVLLLIILINYLMAILADRTRNDQPRRKLIITVTLLLDLSILFVFKYLNFTIHNINTLAQKTVLPQTSIALPIGISFMTFQAISYVIDVMNGKGSVQKNPLNVGLYIAMFPQLIAGPIVRYATVSEEISVRQHRLNDFADGIRRFIVGLAKKVIISNTIAKIADQSFAAAGTQELTLVSAWIGAVAYTLQIYYDFSGYSDMAIGLGRIFGFHFLENFDYPYISKSVTEFWRRWHISLGSWFRDYVYIPLGGSRGGMLKTIRNLFVVWLLTGIWHGANWTFITWGLMYFVLLTIEKITKIPQKISEGQLKWYRIPTLLFVVLGWVIFRSDSLPAALLFIRKMFDFSAGLSGTDLFMLTEHWLIFAAAILFSAPVVPFINSLLKKSGSKTVRIVSNAAELCCLTLLGILSIIFVISSTYNPFIYFNF